MQMKNDCPDHWKFKGFRDPLGLDWTGQKFDAPSRMVDLQLMRSPWWHGNPKSLEEESEGYISVSKRTPISKASGQAKS